jgi:hypothetical protein
MNNNLEWANEFNCQDLKQPLTSMEGEQVYTLRMEDFLKMPEVNFVELAMIDPHLRALMN